MVTIVVIVVLVLTDALLAIVAGLVARARGRRFWFWAVIGVMAPVVAILAVLFLPRPGRS